MEIRIIQDLMDIDQMEEMLNIDMEVRLLEDEISKLSEERERLLRKSQRLKVWKYVSSDQQ